ncbi:aminotransferase class IV [Seleniivibrio woodruffii]|uniref:aminotransferase class IV n=1 Tax=Seleniivibrio woodruffii TaxID=1078050 RepID=UPI0024092AF2|nr:aminotransferase class IV [Seleniivibrio woodruffii]
MSLLFETIKLDGGRIFNLRYHQARVDAAFKALFPKVRPVSLEEVLEGVSLPADGLYRLRVSYSDIRAEAAVFPYVRRKINRLVLIEDDSLSYPHKFENREMFQKYSGKFAPDEEPLFVVNGQVTDTTFSNIVLNKGNVYVTPKACLLKGTKRQQMLDTGIITEMKITPGMLSDFETVHIINALNGIGDITVSAESVVVT